MEYQCNNELFVLLSSLRDAQKRFFTNKPGSLARTNALVEAKKLEKTLDTFLVQRGKQTNQTELF